MEAFVLCSLIITVICVSLSVIFLINKSKTSKAEVPPGSTGWPVVGESRDIVVSGSEKFIFDRMKKYSSEVFKSSILGEKMVVLCGAAGNKFLFSNDNILLKFWWPKSFLRPIRYANKAQHSLKASALLNRGFIVEALKPEYLKRNVPAMDSIAKQHIADNWAPFGEVKVYHLAKKHMFVQVCKMMLSMEDMDDVKRLSDAFSQVVAGMFSVPINFPGTSYNRAMKGSELVRSQAKKMINTMREEMAAAGKVDEGDRDFLGLLLNFTDDKGRSLTDVEICDYICGLLLGAYDTTSILITYALKHLAEFPHIYDQVYEEQVEIAKSKGENERLSWNDIQKMKYTWNVACETMRLFPPAQWTSRETVTDFTLAGYTIPKGWKIFWSPYSTHKNSEYFEEPKKFDPSRFEGNGPKPFTFVPFGGGPRMCPGKEYARVSFLVFMHNVVTNFKIEPLMPHEKIVYRATPIPANGFPVKLIPIKIN